MGIGDAIQNQNERDGHLKEMLGKLRLAHHAAGLAPHCSVEHRDHALMAPGHQCVEFGLGTGQHRHTLISG